MSRFSKTTKPDECALITELVARRLAYPVALAAKRLGLSANAVTLMGGGCWVVSAPTMLLGSHALSQGNVMMGWGLLIMTAVLWNLGYILDLADGSLARMTDAATPAGFFLDYVFHLLFKPMFLSSIGFGVYLLHPHPLLLVLAAAAIPANWSASASSAEHVVCQLTGKGKLKTEAMQAAGRETLFLGKTDIHATAGEKRKNLPKLIVTLAQEILSYYGQFPFFSALLLIDLLSRPWQGDQLLVTGTTYAILTACLVLRIPFRIHREYKRISTLQ